MLKRLIEVALPLAEVSAEAAADNRVRSGHIRTLHIWWARRPLAACRAILFAGLVPDPDDPDCPQEFRTLVNTLLKRSKFTPTNGNGTVIEDTPRNRCLEFIKHLVKWDNSNDSDYLEPAQKLIAAAHKILNPGATSDRPSVLDPFAGGGAMPLEALRLGCESHAVELNPVAHLIELCVLQYPQKFGRSDSRPVPPYIAQLLDHNRVRREAEGELDLFQTAGSTINVEDGDGVPVVEISEDEYRTNPLAADVKYWGHWVFQHAEQELAQYFPSSHPKRITLANIWARTVKCPNPSCEAIIPCINQLWLCKKLKRKVALRLNLSQDDKSFTCDIVEGSDIDFDPSDGTMKRGKAACPFCQTVASSKYLQKEGHAGRISQRLLAVVEMTIGQRGKIYRTPTPSDESAYQNACSTLSLHRDSANVPNEPLKAWSGVFNAPLFGMTEWGKLHNERQLLSLTTFVRHIRAVHDAIRDEADEEYATVVTTYLAFAFDKCLDFASTLCRWGNDDEGVTGTFGRQALPMIWDYAESNPLQERTGGFLWALRFVCGAVLHVSGSSARTANAVRGSASAVPFGDEEIDCVATDPPYYDAVPYSDLSDYFYVWLKRTIGDLYPALFTTPLTPKANEIVSHLGNNYPGSKKSAADYEDGMASAFSEMRRVLTPGGLAMVMFAHKTTTAWENLIEACIRSGLSVTASWPIRTEGRGRLRAHGSAALASSVTLVCRKRTEDAGDGLWDDVRQELKEVAKERLDFFWDQGIRGADFFISAIGPALSVFGRYARVIRLSGEEVTVGEFLDEVRSLVTGYALTKILHTTNTANIDPESRFYVVWKWSYGDAKVPADESFKLAQALGIDTEEMWDKTGVLTKSGENVQCLPVENRMKVKDLGEPDADGTPASLIDVLHRMCVFRDKSDSAGMAQFLGNSGQARNPALWLVAQAISETLPDGEREKQLMQGLLNQQEGLEEATRQGELF